jgi:hypothetical protein
MKQLNHSHLLAWLTISSLLLLAPAADAIPITFNFFQGGYTDGANLSGTFTVEDTNSDGVILGGVVGGEVQNFVARYSGSSLAPAFTVQDASFSFNFNLTTYALSFFMDSPVPPTAFASVEILSDGTGIITYAPGGIGGFFVDISTARVSVPVSVPEGSPTAALLSLSLLKSD